MANIGHRTYAIVRHCVHNDGRAADAIAFVTDFLIGHAVEVARGLVDIALDIVGRHIGGLGLVHCQTQARVGAQIAAALAGCDHDFTNDARPDAATFFILATLAVLDVGPFAVSCHRESFDI